MAGIDPYEILGVAPDADPDQIRAAFRRSVRERHPDTSETSGDASDVRDVIAAYRLLADPAARIRYDTDHPAQGAAGRDGPVRGRTAPRQRRLCTECWGSGTVRSAAVCPRCGGRAEFTRLEPTAARVLRCPACRGSGLVRSVGLCGRCGGSGASSG